MVYNVREMILFACLVLLQKVLEDTIEMTSLLLGIKPVFPLALRQKINFLTEFLEFFCYLGISFCITIEPLFQWIVVYVFLFVCCPV